MIAYVSGDALLLGEFLSNLISIIFINVYSKIYYEQHNILFRYMAQVLWYFNFYPISHVIGYKCK